MGSKNPARNRDRRVARRAAAEILAGGTFRVEGLSRVEGLRGAVVGAGVLGPPAHRIEATQRWRSPESILQPGESLTLDPRHWPAGAELGIVRSSERRTPQAPIDYWMLYGEVAVVLLRTVKTIQNVVYKHRLARRTFWDGRGRYRKRVTMLPPDTVRRLAELAGKGFLIRR